VTFLEGASGLLACRAVLCHLQGDMDARQQSVRVSVVGCEAEVFTVQIQHPMSGKGVWDMEGRSGEPTQSLVVS
jgi:hypothetical protein